MKRNALQRMSDTAVENTMMIAKPETKSSKSVTTIIPAAPRAVDTKLRTELAAPALSSFMCSMIPIV